MKNRTIPMTTKEEVQIQTDVNLINQNYVEQVRRSSQQREIRFSQLVSESIILKSFSNNQVFQELTHLIGDLKKQGLTNENVQKRLSLIEKEIQGLMKRDLLLQQKDSKAYESTDYYSIIAQMEKQKIKLEYQLSYENIKVQRYERKIADLEKQIFGLRQTVELTKNSLLENKIYKDFANSLREQKKIDNRRFTELENQLKKISNSEKKQNKMKTEKDEQANELWGYFSNQIEKLQKQGKMSKQNLNQTLFSLYQMNSTFNADLSSSFEFKSKYEDLQSKYQQLASVFKQQVESIIKDNPSIKGLKSLQELVSLTEMQERQIELINISGWIGIGRLSHGATYFASSQETQTQEKRMLVQLAKQLKLIIDKYPKITSELSKQTTFLLQNNEFLQQLISTESLGRIKQIITYQPQVIRVDNVYQYSNKKDQQLLFNMRVLIKALLEELEVIRKKYNAEITLDAGLVEMMKSQVIEGVDVEDILALYRPLPKIIQVEKVIEKPVYINGTLEKGIPIKTEKAILAEAITQKAVQVIKQVPFYIQKVVNNPTKEYVEVQLQNEKIVQVPTIRQLVVEKVMVNEKLNDVEVEKLKILNVQQIVEVKEVQDLVIKQPVIVEVEKLIEVPGPKQYIEIQKVVQKPVYIRETREKIKQVELVNEKIFERDRYIQIQRQVPHIITNRQTVYLDRQVPRFITNTQERQVNVTQVIQKIVPYKVIEEKVVEIPVVQEKEVLRQVQKEVVVEMTHFIKGDRQEIIKEVEVIVQKPIREEFLITKQLQVQKVVPLYFKEQKPVYVEMQMPYVQSEPRVINQQVARIVPLRQEIIKQVKVQVPVPVIVEKEVVKIETVFVDKIIEKIVEVPRIVQIQKIVEKIVPVPRIIQKIVEVPRIIEKVVTVQVPCLQIVEVFREIPVIKEVQVIKEVIIQKPVIEYVKQIEIVERDKMVEIVVQKQVPKEVEVERRIPTEVIREVPVEVFRDRIVEKVIEIHEVTVKDREVMIPFKHEVPVEFIVQKPIITQKIIENIIKVPQIIEKEKPITQTITIPEIVEVKIEKPIEIEVVKQIPGPETIKYIEIPKQIQVLREKVVQVQNTIQVPKQVYLYMDKIVHEYHERSFPIHVPKLIEQPYLVEVKKPQHFIHYKQIPVQIQTNRNVPVRTFVDQIKEVQKQIHHHKQVEIVKQIIKQIVNETRQFIEKEIPKEILRQVVINQTKVQKFEIPGETQIVQNNNTTVQVQPTTNYVEKVVERIVMLPQIVEVVKHLHSISEVQSPGVAVNVSIEEQTKQFTSVSTQLHTALSDLLEKFKQNVNRQPDLKNIIPIIEAHLQKVQQWVNFPKIVQVQKIVEKTVQKDKVVLVPTSDHQRQASLSYLVQKLVLELRRIKDRNRIQLQLEDDIQRLFFKDPKAGVISERKVDQFNELLKEKYASLGQWKQSYPFMIQSFLQDYFTLNSTITQLNNTNASLQQNIKVAQAQLQDNEKDIIRLQSHNSELLRNYDSLLKVLKDVQNKGLNQNQISTIVKEYGLTKYQQKKLSQISQSQVRASKRVTSSVSYVMEEGTQTNQQISSLISKSSRLESQNIDLNNKVKNYEKQVKLLQSQIQKLKSSQESQRISENRQTSPSSLKAVQEIKSRLINENQQKIKRLQQSQNQEISRLKVSHEKQIQRLKISNEKEVQRIKDQKMQTLSSEVSNEKRKLEEELRNIKRDFEVEKRSTESLKQNHEREIENLKKQYELTIQKKDNNISSIETVKAKISEDYERKIKELKQFYEKQLERLKNLQSLRKEEPPKEDHKQKQNTELKDRIKRLEIELETNKKQLEVFQQQKSKMVSTTYTAGSVYTSSIKQPSDIVQRERMRERYSPQHNRTTNIETYQSAIERKYVSPVSVKSKQDDTSSRKSSSSRKSEKASKYKAQMTLRQFMDSDEKEDKENCSNFIMIKIMEKIEEQAKHGILHSFSPSNIYLSNFNPRNLQSLSIKFGAPIVNKNNKNDGLYLAPEILAGQKTSQKSIVFTLGVIWDELIHGTTYFKSIKEIENTQLDFKVTGSNLNPIMKNTLFEMMNKDPTRRLELNETKRRLSLQKYIATTEMKK